MFARALLSLHPAPLSAFLQNIANSNYSHTGHPTEDVHPEPAEGFFSCSSVPLAQSTPISAGCICRSAKFNYSRTYEPLFRNSNHSRTYATAGGGGIARSLVRNHQSHPASPFTASLTQKQGGGGLVIPIATRGFRLAPPLFWSRNTGHGPRSFSSHQSPLLSLFPVLQWPASFPISSGESLHA
jgi:hypothetical protein